MDEAAGFDVLYLFDTTYRPKGLRLDEDVEGVTYWRTGKLPFVPHAGMEIDCGDGDFRQVQNVYYAADRRRVDVYFEDCDLHRSHGFMVEHGWTAQGAGR